MRNGRRDGNHAEIVKALRKIPGVSVADTADLGDGFPDIAVGMAGKTYLFEIKNGELPPSKRKLTEAETKFFDGWTGHAAVVCSLDEALELLQLATIDAMLAVGGDNSQGVAK